MDKCPPPDVDCLWRVRGISRATQQLRQIVGLVRAPTREAALRVAQAKYGQLYSDLEIRGDPIPTI